METKNYAERIIEMVGVGASVGVVRGAIEYYGREEGRDIGSWSDGFADGSELVWNATRGWVAMYKRSATLPGGVAPRD